MTKSSHSRPVFKNGCPPSKVQAPVTKLLSVDVPQPQPHGRDATPSVKPKAVDGEPKKVDFRSGLAPVYDQGQTNTCAIHAITACYDYDRRVKKRYADLWMPSRSYLYYNGLYIFGKLDDSLKTGKTPGVGVYAVAQSVVNWGACKEDIWPFEQSRLLQHPKQACYDEGGKSRALASESVPRDEAAFKKVLDKGIPIAFGIFGFDEILRAYGVYEIKMPEAPIKFTFLHAFVAVGYDDEKKAVICRNSWGTDWGDKGHCTFPYEFMFETKTPKDFPFSPKYANYPAAYDFHIIRDVAPDL